MVVENGRHRCAVELRVSLLWEVGDRVMMGIGEHRTISKLHTPYQDGLFHFIQRVNPLAGPQGISSSNS